MNGKMKKLISGILALSIVISGNGSVGFADEVDAKSIEQTTNSESTKTHTKFKITLKKKNKQILETKDEVMDLALKSAKSDRLKNGAHTKGKSKVEASLPVKVGGTIAGATIGALAPLHYIVAAKFAPENLSAITSADNKTLAWFTVTLSTLGGIILSKLVITGATNAINWFKNYKDNKK